MNIETIKANNLLAGGHFFSPDAMRFFKTRVFSTIYQGKYFITRETDPTGCTRFTVREAIDEGKSIKTVLFFAYRTLAEARQAARSEGAR